MIDNRLLKEFEHETDEALQGISDTSIIMNFQQAIVSLYPHLIPISAFAYDSWDDIVMPLFYEMVYKTFAFKYGIDINWNETHTYMFSLRCYKGINHIECIPKHPTFKALVNCEWIEMDQNNLDGKVIVFKSFGDGEHFISGGLDIEEAYKVSFNLVEVDIVTALTGYPSKTSVYINNDDLDFEFVAETFDKELQR
ncbi:hypothetical protein D1B31_01875 [Neobacillus notoginsengisoli]|uniref:Uncharacterized protein n=1 Tax=Neobacillus notoginsengisoli TaxID=1578198 RepID=A0A417YZV7_9BACI|nr:hypothetical protein [Neobacillus notoginsengisoli]RHW43433.1 hypothetical protein D1B31_01875 [Neobacillus notoginsengisoli]